MDRQGFDALHKQYSFWYDNSANRRTMGWCWSEVGQIYPHTPFIVDYEEGRAAIVSVIISKRPLFKGV